METTQGTQMGTPESSNGPIVGIIIVILVLIIGAFYFFTRISEIQNTPTPLDGEQAEFAPTSDSNEVSAIESDLEAENFDDIDAELRALDAEFGS